ncbi:MAG: FlgO family outer membrane protein [Campylobacterota bacterium]|nr:FlgO family outer membrane protein [Campylobacterota bacterium]
MKILLSFVTLSLIIFFVGCSSNRTLTYSKIEKEKEGFRTNEVKNRYIDYGILADESLKSLFKKNELPTKIIVTDFVDITSLDNHRKLGYVLSNNIKNSLINNYDISVVESEVSKFFKISGNGLKILSRDVDKLRSTNFNVQYAIVGTYTYSTNELIVFVKLIDLKTGIIKGSYANAFAMGEGTSMMLSTK